MIEKFEYYLNKNLVKKQYITKEEAISLIEKAIARLEYIKGQKITEENASFIFEDIYESIRESAQSLMALKGYKPYSHEVLISFVREFFNIPENLLSDFDRYRILRNKCVYSAFRVSSIVCKDALKFLEVFLPKLKKEFEKEAKKCQVSK